MSKILASFLCVLLLAGCTATLPIRHESVLPSFRVKVDSRTGSLIKLRCTLSYPPGERKADVWSPESLAVEVGPENKRQRVQFTILEAWQDAMFTQSYQESSSRFVLSPIGVKRRSRGSFVTSQAVISINVTEVQDFKTLTVKYDGKQVLKSENVFEQAVSLER